MAFPLGDVRRSYGRSGSTGGPPDVRPYLLAGANLAGQRPRLRAVIAWHEAHLGLRRAEVDPDELARVAGDYRLARCLAACLQGAFRYVAEAPGEGAPGTPSDLRLRLFEQVAAGHGGFVTPQGREAVLAAAAEGEGLPSAADLEHLLWLDADANHRLRRAAPEPPTPANLAAAYNRRALATLLVRSLSADLVLPDPDGADIRRLYFLVKRHGLLCDLDLVEPALGPGGGVHVHLYGPLEVFGPRTRHGDRFAGVVLGLLFRFPDLEGNARVLLNEREYRVVLGPDVAEALGTHDPLEEDLTSQEGEGEREGADQAAAEAPAPPADAPVTAVVARPQVVGAFDSEVEARLFTTLQGMERRGDAAGWVVEREPEPLIHGTTVMVPDFILARPAARGRPALRIFVEVIGFWTPAYRERKRDKLRQLSERVPLVLVIQEGLAEHFRELPFPVLTYKRRVAAGDLIRLLNRHFVRPAESLPAVRDDLLALLQALDPGLGFVDAVELSRTLELPTAGALAEALQGAPLASEDAPGWCWVPGAGVAHEGWLTALRERFASAVDGAGGEADLDGLREALRRTEGGTGGPPGVAEHLEALLGVLGYEVRWRSLFEATVRRAGVEVQQEDGATSASP